MERVKALLKSDRPLTWLFYGDSITHGAVHTHGWRSYSEIFAERVRYEMGRMLDMVLNTAVGGDTTQDLLDSFDWRVTRFQPDVAFLMIGMNDASKDRNVNINEFRANLNELADRFEKLDSLLVLQTTSPILPNTTPDREPYFNDYMQVIRDIAAERQLPLIDHTKYWQDNIENLYPWMNNEFHPNEFGHRVFAKLIFQQLGVWDSNSLSCRMLIPTF